MSARIENLRIIADYSSPRFTPHYNCELCQPSQPFAALLLHVLICHVPGDSYTLHVSRVGTRPPDTVSGGQWSPVCGNTANTGPGSLCECGQCRPVSALPLGRKPVDLSTTWGKLGHNMFWNNIVAGNGASSNYLLSGEQKPSFNAGWACTLQISRSSAPGRRGRKRN